jgi:3-phenylpropionate/trans-cinnamate dioxygenase ferredoxin component
MDPVLSSRCAMPEEPAMLRFVRVVSAAEIPSDRGRPVFVDGKVVVLFKVDGAIHALDDSCPHAGSSLSGGKLEGAFVQCPGHGLRFDVRTGRMRGVDGFCVKTYPVRVVDGEVSVGSDCGQSPQPDGDGAATTEPAAATARDPGRPC